MENRARNEYYPERKKGFSSGSSGKESACNAGDEGSIPGLGRSPGEGNGLLTPVFLLGESHGQRSLCGLKSMRSQKGCT